MELDPQDLPRLLDALKDMISLAEEMSDAGPAFDHDQYRRLVQAKLVAGIADQEEVDALYP